MERPAVVDAHHHLWRYDAAEFPWIGNSMGALRRDFLPADLLSAARSAGVDRTVAVQARQSLVETRDLLAAAAVHPAIAGVVGWLPLADAGALAHALAEFSGNAALVGARHVVQGEPAGFLAGAAFNEGILALGEAGLAYDLLLHAGQLREAIAFVDRHPQGRFVLDHLAKPHIAAGELEPWTTDLRALAARENVWCKLSGMVTEARWDAWSLDTLRPYLDAAVEAFGIGRLMAGSDWPVCLVASSYARWFCLLHEYFAGYTVAEQSAVFGGNAVQFYRLRM